MIVKTILVKKHSFGSFEVDSIGPVSETANDIRLDRIFSAIQILQGTTILPLLPEVLLATALDGHFLLLESQEQPEEWLALMRRVQIRFTEVRPQSSQHHFEVICSFIINNGEESIP